MLMALLCILTEPNEMSILFQGLADGAVPSGCHTVFYDNDLDLAEIRRLKLQPVSCLRVWDYKFNNNNKNTNVDLMPSLHKKCGCVFKYKQ